LWAVDTWDAVAAEVAAALNLPLMLGGSFVRLAKAMHERLPLLGMVLAAGDIDYRSLSRHKRCAVGRNTVAERERCSGCYSTVG
jgi:hypothetical protein